MILSEWFDQKATRTWVAHGIVSLGVACIGAVFGTLLWHKGILCQAIAASMALLFYMAKEMADEIIHKREGLWNTPQWSDKVTYAVDQAGDLIAPLFVCLTSWLAYAHLHPY